MGIDPIRVQILIFFVPAQRTQKDLLSQDFNRWGFGPIRVWTAFYILFIRGHPALFIYFDFPLFFFSNNKTLTPATIATMTIGRHNGFPPSVTPGSGLLTWNLTDAKSDERFPSKACASIRCLPLPNLAVSIVKVHLSSPTAVIQLPPSIRTWTILRGKEPFKAVP
ncbi:MAG: hypothetical protein LUQ65_13440, partial [Candidatus Helarchaeota archaeon]|nr:hypothetical protein [Candidatus Helarchaeota archaeon]